MYEELKTIIERTWEDRTLLGSTESQEAIRRAVELVDKGLLRCAEPLDGAQTGWQVNEWVKKAIIMYFPIQPMRTMRGGELEWYDKMELKHDYERLGVRVVPQAVARYGAYIAYKGKNYRIPKGADPAQLTLDECLKIVAGSKK